MHAKVAVLAAVLALSAGSYASAGPAVDAAERAEALLAEGKTLEAIEALESTVDALCAASPLIFRSVAVVSEPGVYEPRADSSFKPDETILVYVEPVCFDYGSEGGASTIGFTADVSLENATGQVLSEAADAFAVSTSSAAKRREFSMTLSLQVPYVRPGDYTATFTVHDANSDKSGSFEVPFTVTLPAAQ